MRSLARTPFGAILRTEVLLNSKRVAPYAMLTLFTGNAVLWWGWGAAGHYGWATNSEYYIIRNLTGFSFMTLPLFTAVIMGDPVIRDFRLGVSPLILSKPVGRAAYLLGKFFGNFFVLFCCQLAFALTLLLLQGLSTSRMVVLPMRVVPYFKHFLVIVVVSHLFLAAVYFTVGTLTRSPKVVYALAVFFYPLYIIFQVILKAFPPRWRVLPDPLLMNWTGPITKGSQSGEFLNHLAFSYDSDVTTNRALTLLMAAACLTVLYFRFTRAEGPGAQAPATLLGLSAGGEAVYGAGAGAGQRRHSVSAPPRHAETRSTPLQERAAAPTAMAIPKVKAADEGIGTYLKQLVAALGVEFRLLRAERGLILLAPLVVVFSTLELAFSVTPDVSYSAAYASGTAKTSLLFLFGLTIFYTGEAMHRDRETRIEPVLWSVPAPNFVLLLSKFFATLLMSVSLIALIGLTAVVLQSVKGEMPVEISAYLAVYWWILIPSVALAAGVSVALNVLLRDKYLTYMVSFATVGGLYYLYSLGYYHWLYNPVLYRLWTYADLTGAGSPQSPILTHRVYCLAITCLALALAHLCFPRRLEKGFEGEGPLGSNGWSFLMAVISLAVAVITGLLIALPGR